VQGIHAQAVFLVKTMTLPVAPERHVAFTGERSKLVVSRACAVPSPASSVSARPKLPITEIAS
jgi:hypothetical protein